MLKRLSIGVAAVALLAAPALEAQAQTGCVELRGISQLTYDPKVASYAGPVWLAIGDELLIGKNLPNDEPPATVCDDMSCQDSGGKWRLDFGKGDTLAIQAQIATYSLPGGGVGMYYGTERIVGGTGRFQHATGKLFEKGPFAAWIDAKGELQAQYSGETGGSICGVPPRKAAAVAEPAPKAVQSVSPAVTGYRLQQVSPGLRR